MDNSLITSINELKKQKNAIILAHYYVNGEIQDIADYVGDSFYLSKIAASTNADIIVFCGVSFMGESAKMLNPNKTVLMPDINADCAMAHMCEVSYIEKIRKEYEDVAVVCYINSTAELKSHSDVCVTSSNALNHSVFSFPSFVTNILAYGESFPSINKASFNGFKSACIAKLVFIIDKSTS
mgnify:CR=1 FL=1